MYEAISSETYKAKKTHRCFGCCAIINPGETYRRDAGKFEGEFQTTKHCAACVAIEPQFFEHLRSEWGECTYSEGDVGVYRQEAAQQ